MSIENAMIVDIFRYQRRNFVQSIGFVLDRPIKVVNNLVVTISLSTSQALIAPDQQVF